jgi:hypothetical protein
MVERFAEQEKAAISGNLIFLFCILLLRVLGKT